MFVVWCSMLGGVLCFVVFVNVNVFMACCVVGMCMVFGCSSGSVV